MILSENNPWLGLESYSINDAYRFYGRNRDIEVVCNAIYDNFITTIYGISGSGKTSLLNAGLTPTLKEENYLPIRIRLQHNADKSYSMQIIEAVEKAVESLGGEVEYNGIIPIETIDETERLWFFLHTRRFWTKNNYPIRPVIFIDQFEEIFTQNDETSKIVTFFELINAIQYNTPPINTKMLLEKDNEYFDLENNTSRFVFIIREDFLARLEDYSYGIAALRRNRIGIKRMDGYQALEVILNPIPGLITREGAIKILSKVSGSEVKDSNRSLERISIDTAILSLFCSELYQRAVEEKCDTISVSLIEELGGNIISSFYIRNMSQVSSLLVDYIEKHLLTFSGYRNSIALEDIEIPKLAKDKINAELAFLAEKRILRIEDTNEVVRVEFTHDVLCKIAKNHRDNKKQQKLNRRNRWISILKSIDMLIIMLISFWMWKHFGFDVVHRVNIIPVTLLFLYTFARDIDKQRDIPRCLSSILLSCLIIPIPYIHIPRTFPSITQCVYIIFLFSSVILSIYTFLKQNRRKTSFYFLLCLNLLMLTYVYRYDIACWFVLFVFLLVLPQVRYINNNKSYLLSVLISLTLIILLLLIEEEEHWIIALYPLTIFFKRFFIPKESKSMTLKSLLVSCLQCDVYKQHRNIKIPILLFGLFIIVRVSSVIGSSLSDRDMLRVPILAALVFVIISSFFSEISVKSREYITNRYVSKNMNDIIKFDSYYVMGVLVTSIISLLIFACQYIPYGVVLMCLIWVTIFTIVLLRHYKCKKYLGWTIVTIIVSLIIIPLNCIGYNIFSHIEYSKSVRQIVGATREFIIIRDLQGNYGVRDRYNMIVPVEYAEIMDVRGNSTRYYGSRSLFSYSSTFIPRYHRSFSVYLRDNQGYNNETLSYYECPNISFFLKKHSGDNVIWNCNQHLDMPNLCTSIIMCNAEKKLDRSDPKFAYNYFCLLESAGINSSRLAKKQVEYCFNQYLSHDLKIDSIVDLKMYLEKQKTLSHSTTQNIRLALNVSHRFFPFIEDDSFVNLIANTLSTYAKPQSNTPYDVAEFYNTLSRCYLYGKMFNKAEEYALKATEIDSLFKLPYLNIVESLVAREEYDKAIQIIEMYGNEMCYQGKIYREITNEEERIIYGLSDSCSTILRYNSIINLLNKDLPEFELCGLIPSTTSAQYKAFKNSISNRNCRVYDSAEDRGEYYLCRKYYHYNNPEGERYRNAFYGDDCLQDFISNNISYQFYMADNIQISPSFLHYAMGLDDNTLLVIDELDHKRKYINKEGNIPTTIPGSFDHAWRFSEGKAAVVINGKLGFINHLGEYVIDTTFTYSVNSNTKYVDIYNRSLVNFVDFTFHKGLCPMIGSNGKYGLINQKGDWIVGANYESLTYIDQCNLWLTMKCTNTNNEGLNVNYGAIDTNGNIIIESQYNHFILFDVHKRIACWGNENNDYLVLSSNSYPKIQMCSIINTDYDEWSLTYSNGETEMFYEIAELIDPKIYSFVKRTSR